MVQSMNAPQPQQPFVPAAMSVDEPWAPENLTEAIELWSLKSSDAQQLMIMQKKLQDVDHPWNDPHVVIGFGLSEGGWDTTEERFRKMIQWRLDNNVDELMTNYRPNPLLLDNSPIAFLKDYDKDGDPIYLERGGMIDVRGLLSRFSREEVMRHAIWLREVQCGGAWIDEYEQRQGRTVTDLTVVYDLAGLSTSHLHPTVIGFFQQFMQITEDYYPGPIKRMIIIRAPYLFQIVWKTVKHFFSEESRNKMIFAGDDYLDVLSEYMDINVLPPCINPNGTGTTAQGMPVRMDGGAIDDSVGPAGAGYIPPPGNSGVSLPPTPATATTTTTTNATSPVKNHNNSSTSSVTSDTESESEDASSVEGTDAVVQGLQACAI